MSIFEDITAIQNIIYIVASILFISGIKMLGKEDTAVKVTSCQLLQCLLLF